MVRVHCYLDASGRLCSRACGGGLLDGLSKRIEDAMKVIGGGHVTVVEEPLYAGANGALQLALDMPGEYWQQLR